ncbi:MAG: 16S rRNA processing protein RimM [Bryobacterales bacterium]|nr:16S rRNA processing protein RimM [Bryobacterales bacterium]
MAEWVTIALIRRARGNRGEVAALSRTSDPERFRQLKRVILFAPGKGEGQEAVIESAWEHNGRLILKFQGVQTISDAEKLAGWEVRIPLGERRQLPPDEYYHSDLVGCEMFDHASGERLGTVVAAHEYGGPLVLEVAPPDGTRFLVPFARAICPVIDVDARRIEANLPEGLRD